MVSFNFRIGHLNQLREWGTVHAFEVVFFALLTKYGWTGCPVVIHGPCSALQRNMVSKAS